MSVETKLSPLLSSQKEGDFLKSGKGEEAIDGKVANPMVDIVCLLSTIGDSRRSRSSLQQAIDWLNASLIDDPEISAPSYYRPEWPEKGPEAVISDINANKSTIEASMKGKEGDFLKSQYRAIDYLYGKGEEAIDGKVANPMVDIVCLLSTIGDSRRSRSSLQLAVEGPPVPIPYFVKPEMQKKPEQRTVLEDQGKTQEVRTVSRFKNQITTVIRSLFILGEAAKHHPLVIESVLSEYSQRYAGGKDEIAGTAMGLLEIIHTLGLSYDGRFYSLAEQLRAEVLDKVGTYTELKKRFSYSIVNDRHFWYQGVSQKPERRRMSYVKSNESCEPVLRRKIVLEPPIIENWQTVSRKRREITRTLRGLTLFNSVKATAIDFNKEKTIKRVVSDRLKKADLTVQKREIERKEADRLRDIWRNFLEAEVNEDTTLGKAEEELFTRATREILKFFAKDETLSQKAKANINFLDEGSQSAYYDIDASALAQDPLFSWILALRNPYVREAFSKAVFQNEGSTSSFYLLLKGMTFDVLKRSLGKKELEFLFDPNYLQKIDAKALREVLEKIELAAKEYVPDLTEIAKNAISLGDSQIEDLLTPESIRRYQLKLENLTYKRILDFFWKDKSKAFTEADKKRVRQIVKWIMYVGSFSLMASLISKGIGGLLENYIEVRLEAINLAAEAQAQEERLAQEARAAQEERVARLTEAREIARREVERARAQDSEPGSFRAAEDSTRVSAESVRLPGEIDDRIPDAIRQEGDSPPPESERFVLTSFGRIYHLPESLPYYDGMPVGYFPWDINLQEYQYTDIDTRDFFWGETQPLEQTHIVGSIDDVYRVYGANQLAYSTNGVNAEMYPPIGYRFVEVYQEGGKVPMIGPLGELYYGYDNMDNFPARALFVLEPVEMQNIDPKINILENQVGSYYPYFHQREAEELTRDLSGDPVLQEIHRSFIEEVDNLDRQFSYGYYTGLDFDEYVRQYSEIGIRYATEYARYTSENRFYALGFQIEGDGVGWDSITSLTSQPENGYFCSVAAFAFRDFMASAGFVVGNQPGITLVNSQGYLWGGIGHMNNIVFLPDGRVLEVDMTPYVTGDTPESDLDFLRGRIVTAEDIRMAIEEMVRSQAQTQAPPQPVDDRDAARRMVAEQERIRRIAEGGTFVSDEDFNSRLEEIVGLANEMLSREIASRAQTSGDIDAITRNSEEYAALRRIMANAERIRRNPPTMLDIQLERSNPDMVYSEYSQLEQILSDADSLREDPNSPDDNSATIDAIIERAQGLMEDMTSVGREQIEQGAGNARLRSEIERQYMEFYERTGRYPGEITEDDRAWDNIEMQRARRAWLSTIQISDADLQYFDDTLLETINTDLQMFINEMAVRSRNARDLRTLDGDFPAAIPSADMYNSHFTQTSELRQLILNRPELYERLGESARESLERLPSMVRELGEIYAGRTGLTDEQQLARAREISRNVQSVDRAIENYRFPQPEDVVEEQDEQNEHVLSKEQINDILGVSTSAGVGAAVLAFAYLGLRMYKSEKSRKEQLERIKEALNTTKNLSRTEKEIVLSTVGHICHLAYERDFPKKAAELVSLLEQYNPQRHDRAVGWLQNEGADILWGTGIKESYYKLAELANGKARDVSAKEIVRYFPKAVTSGLKRINTHPGNGNGDRLDFDKIEVPHDYRIIYGISNLLLNNSLLGLHDEVVRRLGVASGKKANSITFKVGDFRELLMEKYANGSIPDEVKPLVNAILFILWTTGETSEKVIIS